jgi:hypothetical protein
MPRETKKVRNSEFLGGPSLNLSSLRSFFLFSLCALDIGLRSITTTENNRSGGMISAFFNSAHVMQPPLVYLVISPHSLRYGPGR